MTNHKERHITTAALVLAASLFSSTARADISGEQVEAMGDYMSLVAQQYYLMTLSACVNVYPAMRAGAVQAMERAVPKLKSQPEVVDEWITGVGQCMDKQRPLDRESCNAVETSIRAGTWQEDMKKSMLLVSDANRMLEPCRQ